LSWQGRLQVGRSEGVLSGATLASWGMGLGTLFGLYYATYFAGTVFAVRAQAAEGAEDYLGLIHKRDNLAAFQMMLRPGERIGKGAMPRGLAEIKAASSSPQEPGAYARFTQSAYTRVLQRESATWQVRRFDWKRDQTGYQAAVHYRVTSDIASLNMEV